MGNKRYLWYRVAHLNKLQLIVISTKPVYRGRVWGKIQLAHFYLFVVTITLDRLRNLAQKVLDDKKISFYHELLTLRTCFSCVWSQLLSKADKDLDKNTIQSDLWFLSAS